MFALMWVATLIAHIPALRGAFLWDDNAHVTKPDMRTLHGLWRIWFDLGATQQYYPLLHTAFWIEHHLWGDNAFGYHLIDIAMHAASATLVVLIVRRLKLPGGMLAGFIFALHPVGVESVAWISEQKTTLSALLYLAGALAYLHFDQSRRRSTYFLASGLFALALMSKTVTATLPAALLLVFFWQRGRLSWRRDILPLVPWLFAGAASGLFTAWVERTYIGARGAHFTLSPLQRLLLSGRVICFYVYKLIWPSKLTFVYPHWTIDAGQWWQYSFLIGVLAVLVFLGALARRWRGPLAAFLFFIGTLFPVLGFFNVFPFLYSYVADHFQYLAMLGIIVPVATALTIAATRVSGSRAPSRTAAVALVTVLGAITWRQSEMYRDNETLFRETVVRNPGSSMAHNNLGFELAKDHDRLPEAIEQFEAALRCEPDSAEAHENLGLALSKTHGRLLDGVGHLETALRLQPDYPESHLSWAPLS
jgi:hypothetical protein